MAEEQLQFMYELEGDIEMMDVFELAPTLQAMGRTIQEARLHRMTEHSVVIDALERAPDIVVPLVREVPADILKRRPAPRKWSAHEHACHLAHVHRLFFDRLDYMLAWPSPVITPYEPGESDPDDFLLSMNLEDCLRRYGDDRQSLVARLRNLSDAEWQRTAEHGEYRHYSVFIMFRHLALHDFFHAYRVEELLLKKTWPAVS